MKWGGTALTAVISAFIVIWSSFKWGRHLIYWVLGRHRGLLPYSFDHRWETQGVWRGQVLCLVVWNLSVIKEVLLWFIYLRLPWHLLIQGRDHQVLVVLERLLFLLCILMRVGRVPKSSRVLLSEGTVPNLLNHWASDIAVKTTTSIVTLNCTHFRAHWEFAVSMQKLILPIKLVRTDHIMKGIVWNNYGWFLWTRNRCILLRLNWL